MFKGLFKKGEEEKDKKKQIENIIVCIVILIITVLIINSMWSTDNKESQNNTKQSSKVLAQTTLTDTSTEEQDNLEKKLEEILSSINGVGKVKVLIKYSESSSIVAMYNETKSESTIKESDKSGVSKEQTDTENKKEIVYSDEEGKSKPITEKVVMPVIEGAIITAQGAKDSTVKSSIVSAVEAVTGLAVHKFKKGTAAIYVLALMLVTAGYWAYLSNESKTLETVNLGNQDTTNNVDENLGDATLVNSNEVKEQKQNQEQNQEQEQKTEQEPVNDYFQESKLSRDTMYSQTLETYQKMLDNSNVSEEQKAIVTQEITKLNQEKNAIMICENVLSTKGFNKCVIFVNVDSISVVVGKEKIETDEIAQIQNIVSREMLKLKIYI